MLRAQLWPLRHMALKSTIVMPKYAPLSKISATKSYGAKVVLYGEVYDEAYQMKNM